MDDAEEGGVERDLDRGLEAMDEGVAVLLLMSLPFMVLLAIMDIIRLLEEVFVAACMGMCTCRELRAGGSMPGKADLFDALS